MINCVLILIGDNLSLGLNLKIVRSKLYLGCSYIGLLHGLCKPDRGVQLPYGPLLTFFLSEGKLMFTEVAS